MKDELVLRLAQQSDLIACYAREGIKQRRQIAYLVEALRPFALVDPVRFKSIHPKDAWLWKPSGVTKDYPGISLEHVLNAKSALDRYDKEWREGKKA